MLAPLFFKVRATTGLTVHVKRVYGVLVVCQPLLVCLDFAEIYAKVKAIMSGISVEYIKQVTFSLLPLSEKMEIITRGRPTPNILIQASKTSKKKKYLKSFNYDWYEKIEWLCGCEATNALFCFPCLLFGGDTVWTQNGFTNLNKMREKTEKHQNSRRHIANTISLSLLGQIDVTEAPDTAAEKIKKDKQMKEYREGLLKIIECLKFCGIFELSLRHGNDEFFKSMQNFAANFDAAFGNHLLVFGETSETVQNDLLQHMLEICQEQIMYEIQAASYVSLICHDVSDISDTIQTIIVFRYEFYGGFRERFWGFLDSESVSQDGLSNCLVREINKVLQKDWYKLIAQTFSGPSRGEGQKIQSVYHNAHLIHGYYSDLDLSLKHMTSSIISVRLFFANLASLDKFFQTSPERLSVLYNHIGEIIPHFKSLDVCTVHRIKEHLIECLEELLSLKGTDKTLQAAARFISLLKNESFSFWLDMFNKVNLQLELFLHDIQSIEPDEIPQSISEFCKIINKICNSVNFSASGGSKILECQEVSNSICDEIKEKFAFTAHLSAAKLLDCENFERFLSDLPKLDIRETCQAYPDLIQDKLMMELRVFYSQKKFQGLGILSILNSLNTESLSSVFSETIKLLKILVTLPMSLTESEECYSTVNKVKSCINDTVSSEKLSAYCMLSVESEMVSQIKNFNEKVVQNYCESRKLEFSVI